MIQPPGSPPPDRTARADTLALGVLLAITAVVAWNRLAFDAWLTRLDLMTFFLPWYHVLGERLRAFDVPGWNPHLFSGAPFAGDPESGWMYAPAMLFFSLFANATTAFKGMVAAQLAIAAFSTYAFARVLGMGAVASLVAAVAYTTGPFLHWNTHCCLIFSQFAAWIPLALLGVELALRATAWRNRLAPWFLSAFAISQMLAGWIGEGWLYAFILPSAYTVYRALLSPPQSGIPVRDRVVAGAVTGFAVLILGSALGAAGMLPRYTVNLESNLAGGNYSQLGEEGVLNPPWQLDYLLAQTLGSGAGYHFRAAAFGGAVAILSLLALPLARQRFATPFFAALTLAALILTLDTTPLHHLFYLIPRFREFHDHDAWRTISLAAIGPAMLSGAAVESLACWRGRARLWPALFVPLLLYLLVTIALTQAGYFLGWPAVVAALLTTVLVATALAFPITSGISSSMVTRLVSALVLVVIFLFPTGLELTGSWFGWHWDGVVGRQLSRDAEMAAALAADVSRDDPGGAGEFLQHQMAGSGPFRYVGYGGFGYPGDDPRGKSYMARRLEPDIQALLVNGRAIFLGLNDMQGYNPLQLSRYVEFIAALNGQTQDYHTAYLLPSGTASPLLDLLNVRYVLIDAALPPNREDVLALKDGRKEVLRTPRVIIYERDPAPTKAWIVHDVRAVERGEALPLLAAEVIDPYEIALVEGTPPESSVPPGAASETVTVTRYEPDAMTLAASSAAPGLLVVSQIFSDGWRAYVDGKEVTLLPTFHALQGVPLPAGEHTVELRYDPLSLRVGLIVSATATIAMLGVFAVAGWSAIRRRWRSSAAS